MYRYFVLIWNPRDVGATAKARALSERIIAAPLGWTRVLQSQGVCALHAGLNEGASGTLVLEDQSGAVFGRIFNRDIDDTAAALRVRFDRAESLSVVRSGGRRLIERYWGRYVALVQDASTSETWILRDPSGAMPCLMAVHEGVTLVFSDLEDCFALGVMSFSVNWDYIRALLTYSGYQSRETALREVAEVQFGERVRFSGDSTQRSLEWDPLAVSRTHPIQDPEVAVAELRRTTRACIHAWAACYTNIVHNLSGGLDSSIVLSCLRDAPSRPNVTCLHYFGTGPDEDERTYARLMAGRFDVEMLEHRLDVAEIRLEDLLKLRRSSRPWFYMYELEHGDFETQLATSRGSNALFSGAGGDGVFFQARAELGVTDYLFDHGMGRNLLRVAIDAARVSRKSIWPLLFGAAHARIAPRAWHPLRQPGQLQRPIVNHSLLQAATRDPKLVHPWLAGRSTRAVPPGTLWHIMSVAAAPMYYSSFLAGPQPERTLPLMSQPLIELCLRIPTYVLIKSGIDRATARRAFSPDLPPEIVKRRNKGRIDSHVRNILDANLSIVRDMMLNGRLVKEGLLNRDSLELYLTRERSPADFHYAEILQEHLCIEAWLSRWLGSDQAVGVADDSRAQSLTSSCAPGCR
jgi:asparagine synthase (glutamine-hydrolysing)